MVLWNRKKKDLEVTDTPASNIQMNSSLYRDITQEVAMFMLSAKITEEPILKFFNDDCGILEGMFVQHTTDSEMLQMKRTSQDEYLFVVGMHAFGAGVYVTHMQSEFKKPVNEFSPVELMKLAAAFGETDAYELALNTLGVTMESKKKKILDLIILTALKTLMNTCGDAAFDLQNILAYTQVLYNAGITMVYRS